MTAPQLTQYGQGSGVVSSDNLNTFEQTCNVIADLRGFIGVTGIQVYTRGGTAIGDGNQGAFYWDANSTAADNGFTVIRPTGGAFSGRWVRNSVGGGIGGQNIGLFVNASTAPILPNTQFVQTSGYSIAGVGAAQYAVTSNTGATAYRFQAVDGRWFEIAEPVVYPQMVGAIGNGVADDTAALNAALSYGALSGKSIAAAGGDIYLVSKTGTKAFLGPTSGTFSADYAVEVPSGCSVDFGGCTIKGVAGVPLVLLSNKDTTLLTDKIAVKNVTVNANSVVGVSGSVNFIGCIDSIFDGIGSTNGSFSALTFGALTRCKIDRCSVYNFSGTGMQLGGNTVYQLKNCQIGDLTAYNISFFSNPSQVGNGFLIGMDKDSSISSLTARNCAGGNKFTANCNGYCGSSIFDATVNAGEPNNSSQNSGTKIQGDDTSTRVSIDIGSIQSYGCGGSGLFVLNADIVKIDDYVGIGNATAGLDADVSFDVTNDLSVGSVYSRSAGQRGVSIAAASYYSIPMMTVNNCGRVSATGDGMIVSNGYGRIGKFNSLSDIDGDTKMSVGITIASSAPTGTFLEVALARHYLTSGGVKIVVNNPFTFRRPGALIINRAILGTGQQLLSDIATLNAGTSTQINNENVSENGQTTGVAQSIINIYPWNASAKALLAAGQVFPTNIGHGFFKITSATAAAGTEQFRYSIDGMQCFTTLPV